MKKNYIGIVGGGANGVSIFNELIYQLSKTSHPHLFIIALYEKSGIFGEGLAYGTNLNSHILNMPSNSVSAIGNNPEHFIDWLKKQKHLNVNLPNSDGDYVPRKVFGLYLKDLYGNAKKKAKLLGIDVKIYNEEATDITERDEEILIESSGKIRIFDQVILCLGNQPPTLGRDFKGISGYFHHAWPESTIMEKIPNHEDVLIIGTGLTAIDTFITLKEKGHTAKIKMISKRGLLPKVRTLSNDYTLQYFTIENIEKITDYGRNNLSLTEVTRLMIHELIASKADLQLITQALSLTLKTPLEILENDIHNSIFGNNKYFDVLKAIDEIIGDIWNSLSFRDKRFFDVNYKAIWNSYDYPMPLQNAQKVKNAMVDGQLFIEKGFQELKYVASKEQFQISRKSNMIHGAMEVDKAKFVINATGQEYSIIRLESPIIRNALKNGVLCPHPFGGIDVDFNTCKIRKANGHYSNRLYAVGSLTRGVHFYTNSINENAKCGKRAIVRLVQCVQNKSNLKSAV